MKTYFSLFVLMALTCISASAQDLVNDLLPRYHVSDFIGKTPLPVTSFALSSGMGDYTSVYDFDLEGRLLSIHSDGLSIGWGSVEYFIWDDAGRLVSSKEAAHGSDVSYGESVVDYIYDNNGRLSMEMITTSNFDPFSKLSLAGYKNMKEYIYDANGNIIRTVCNIDETNYHGDKSTYTNYADFFYDENGNVVKATGKVLDTEISQTLEYDEYGNKTKMTITHPDYDGNIKTRIYEYKPILNRFDDYQYIGYIECLSNAEDDESDIESFVYFGHNINIEENNDICNPYNNCNTGDEPLIDFIKTFISEPEFRKERSQSMVIANDTISEVQILIDYNKSANRTPLNIDNDLASDMFGCLSSPEMYDKRSFDNWEKDITYYSSWEKLSKDMAVLLVSLFDRKNNNSNYSLYVFARTDGKWHLIGSAPAPDPYEY